MAEKKEIRLNIRISQSLKSRVEEAAAEQGVTVAEYVKTALIEKMSREEK